MTGVQAYLTLTGGSFDTDLVTERIGLAPDILRRREAGPHGEVSTEWGIRTELEISHNDEVEPALRSLLRRIPCGPQALCEVARTHTAEWHILILVKMYEMRAQHHPYGFDRLTDALKFSADLENPVYRNALEKGGQLRLQKRVPGSGFFRLRGQR